MLRKLPLKEHKIELNFAFVLGPFNNNNNNTKKKRKKIKCVMY